MSIRAILHGVETVLRSAAVLDDPDGKICGIQGTGKPPAKFGQIYYAVHWGGARADRDARIVSVIDAYHDVTVTITAKVGYIPQDARGRVISDSLQLLDLAETLASPGILHGNYTVLSEANALIVGTAEYAVAHPTVPVTTNGFEEPLILFDYGPIKEESPAWISAREGKDIYTIPVRFGRARRTQE